MELLKANVYFKIGGSLSCIELVTKEEKEFFVYAMDNELDLQLGEVNGKYSDVILTLEKNEPDFEFIKLNEVEIEFVKNKLEITSFGDVCFSYEVQKAVFRDFGTKNNVDCEQEFSEWCENEKEIKSISELSDSLISEYTEYCKQFDEDD
ncbi:MAG: hypothetical protein GY870_21645 [archaeon]|nr:hypothetical protein [archaeon]